MKSALENLADLPSLLKCCEGVLLDAYGVFWGGNEAGPFLGATEAMDALVSSGKPVGILSNSTQLAEKEVQKLERHGLFLGRHFHFLLTSGEAARDIFLSEKLPFKTPRKKYFLFGGKHPKYSSHEAIFQGTIYSETCDIDEADFLYLGIPHKNGVDQTDADVFRKEVEEAKESNLPVVCANPDLFAHEGMPPRAVARQGSIARLFEEMGQFVFYIGKPEPYVFQAAMAHFNAFGIHAPDKILMIGDTPETDIRGAVRFGMQTALVTATGMMAERIKAHGTADWQHAILPQDTPNHFIRGLSDVIYPPSKF